MGADNQGIVTYVSPVESICNWIKMESNGPCTHQNEHSKGIAIVEWPI